VRYLEIENWAQARNVDTPELERSQDRIENTGNTAKFTDSTVPRQKPLPP
jgi:hypothetical protein